MNAIYTFLYHKNFLLLVLVLNCKTMSQEEVVSLFIKKTFWFVLFINQSWVFRTNFIFDTEIVDLRVPITMRLWNSPKNYLDTTIHSDKHLQGSIQIIKSILFLTL